MSHPSEDSVQCWRAVAHFADRDDRLLFLGRSSAHVHAGFERAFVQVLDEEERGNVRAITLQRWDGVPDAGRWLHEANLRIPLADAALWQA